MKYKRRTKENYTDDFLMNLLYDREILKKEDDLTKYFHPKADNLIDPALLDNMDEGYRLLKKHLENGSKIYLIVD